MKELSQRIEKLSAACTEMNHPAEINVTLESDCLKAASAGQQLGQPIPKLATLVSASRFNAAQKYKMFLCVQDLTCPGASLIHSAGLAAHVPGVAAIEANSRQYCPAANKEWEPRFPGIFDVRDGFIRTGQITGPGLGAV